MFYTFSNNFYLWMYMLGFKFIFCLNLFKPVWFLFTIVSNYDNEFETMENKIQTALKNVKPKRNISYSIYRHMYKRSFFFYMYLGFREKEIASTLTRVNVTNIKCRECVFLHWQIFLSPSTPTVVSSWACSMQLKPNCFSWSAVNLFIPFQAWKLYVFSSIFISDVQFFPAM